MTTTEQIIYDLSGKANLSYKAMSRILAVILKDSAMNKVLKLAWAENSEQINKIIEDDIMEKDLKSILL